MTSSSISKKFFLLLCFTLCLPAGTYAGGRAVPDPSSTPPTSSASTAPALTLNDCYKLALKQSETIAIQRELIKATEAKFLQSFSGILPSATFSYTQRRQDGTGASNFTLREVPEAKFVFSQPLFSGFKEFAAITASRAEGRQRRQEEIRARQLLFYDVADAFYFSVYYDLDLQALETSRKALVDRLEELRKREQIGRSRLSEVVNTESRLHQAEAEIEFIKSRQVVGRQLLEFLIGQPHGKLIEEEISGTGVELGPYLTKAESRPDVIAAKEAWLVAKNEVTVSRAAYFPEVALDGTYYTKRIGNSAGVDWDATLRVDVPVFQGGRITGEYREARSAARQQELRYRQTKRVAALDIDNSFTQYQLAAKRTALLQQALSLAEKNYELQKEDYTLNLINNLDVLQALQELQVVRREFLSAQNESKRLFYRLQLATGDIAYDAR